MEERRKPGFFETLMRGWRPGGTEPAEAETAEAATKATAAQQAPPSKDAAKTARETSGEKADEKAGAGVSAAAAGQRAGDKQKPTPNLEERMEGVQGWLAEIERRQRRMTRITAAAVLLAVLAAAAAIALSLMTRSDSVTQDDVDELKSQLDGVTEQVTQSTQGQLKQLSTTVGTFDSRIGALEKTQTQVTADINALRRQVNAAVTQANQAATQGAGTTPGAGAAPGTTTTTPGGKQQQP
jgi:hypothetical protein